MSDQIAVSDESLAVSGEALASVSGESLAVSSEELATK